MVGLSNSLINREQLPLRVLLDFEPLYWIQVAFCAYSTEAESSLGFKKNASRPETANVQVREQIPLIQSHAVLLAIENIKRVVISADANQLRLESTQGETLPFELQWRQLLACPVVVKTKEISKVLLNSIFGLASSAHIELFVDLEPGWMSRNSSLVI